VTADPVGIARELAREAGLAEADPTPDGGPDAAGGGRPDPAGLSLGGVRLVTVGVGWATVELARAAVELVPHGAGGAVRPAEPDLLLGAAAWTWRPASPGPVLVLLEPNTEGRLAAGLAHRGEGPLALYLAPSAGLAAGVEALEATGLRCRPGRGPFGEAALVLGRPVAGPQLILVGVPSGA
jgi:hypothetical protein